MKIPKEKKLNVYSKMEWLSTYKSLRNLPRKLA